MANLPIYGSPKREKTGRYRAQSVRLISVLTILDIFGALIPKFWRRSPTDKPLRVLIANWGHLGDVVTVFPIVSYLKNCPEVGEVDLLVGSWARNLVESTDLGIRIYVADHWALNRRSGSWWRRVAQYFGDAIRVIGELRRAKYDVSICTFSTFPATHALTWAAGIPLRIGFNSAGLGTLLTHQIAWRSEDTSALVQQLRLLQPLLGAKTPKALPACYPGYSPVPLPDDLVSEEKFVILHVGAGLELNKWPEEKWIELATQLRLRGSKVIVTAGGGREADVADRICSAALVQNASNRLSWRQFVTLIAGSKAVVTHDTVAGHVAACFAVPTIVLAAGRQRTAYWHPNNPRAVVLSHLVGCYPCNRSNGCDHMACIREIDVAAVVFSLQSIVELGAEPNIIS